MNNNVNIDFLPVGSVVIIKGNIRKMMVIARGVMTKIEGQMLFFDYGAVLYPDGLINDKIIYFNHQDIHSVVFKGFEDDDEKLMKENINDWIKKSNITKGNPYDINTKLQNKK